MLWLPSSVLTAPALLFAGAAASTHCALMCGSLAVHHSQAAGKLSARIALTWLHTGRIAGYAAMGAFAGALGQTIFRHLAFPQLGYVLQIVAALSLFAGGAWMAFSSSAGAAKHYCPAPPPLSPHWPMRLAMLVRGLLWALLPCGLLYSVLLLAAFAGSALQGALLTAAFALGGTPVLAAIGWRFGRSRKASWMGRIAGFWMMLFAAICLIALAWPNSGGDLPWCVGLRS